MKFRRILLASLLLACATFLNAEEDEQVIYLRNGGHIIGRLVNQTRTKVWIRTKTRIQVVPKSAIRRITYDNSQEREYRKNMNDQKKSLAEQYEQKMRETLAKARLEWEQEQLEKEKKRQAAEKVRKETKAENLYISQLWRSAVLPGWGQVYRGEKTKGYIFGGLFAASALLWYQADQDFKGASENLESTSLGLAGVVLNQRSTASIVLSLAVTQELTDVKRTRAARASLFSVAFIGMYLVNVIDAVFFKTSPVSISAGPDFDPAATIQRFPFEKADDPYRNPGVFIRAAYRLRF